MRSWRGSLVQMLKKLTTKTVKRIFEITKQTYLKEQKTRKKQ